MVWTVRGMRGWREVRESREDVEVVMDDEIPAMCGTHVRKNVHTARKPHARSRTRACVSGGGTCVKQESNHRPSVNDRHRIRHRRRPIFTKGEKLCCAVQEKIVRRCNLNKQKGRDLINPRTSQCFFFKKKR